MTSPVDSNLAGIYQVLTSPSNASMAQHRAGWPLPGWIVSDNGYRPVSRWRARAMAARTCFGAVPPI
jgi:hypothetical protein